MEDSSLPELAFTKEEPMKRFLHRLSLLFVVLLLLTTAVFADMGVAIIAVLNAMRAMNTKRI